MSAADDRRRRRLSRQQHFYEAGKRRPWLLPSIYLVIGVLCLAVGAFVLGVLSLLAAAAWYLAYRSKRYLTWVDGNLARRKAKLDTTEPGGSDS